MLLWQAVLLFSKLSKILVLDTLIQKIVFYIMKTNSFQCELTDILAKKEALVASCNKCGNTELDLAVVSGGFLQRRKNRCGPTCGNEIRRSDENRCGGTFDGAKGERIVACIC